MLWLLGGHRLLWSYVDIVTADPGFSHWLAQQRPQGATAFVTTSETNRVLLRHLHEAHAWTTQWAFFEDEAAAVGWLSRWSAE
ncbi:MAG: hypothetical protein HC809_04060 [Gammaproteobacteria bacterium]|nr:hypothetical protein [Gammaproteobacteria bacterium]